MLPLLFVLCATVAVLPVVSADFTARQCTAVQVTTVIRSVTHNETSMSWSGLATIDDQYEFVVETLAVRTLDGGDSLQYQIEFDLNGNADCIGRANITCGQQVANTTFQAYTVLLEGVSVDLFDGMLDSGEINLKNGGYYDSQCITLTYNDSNSVYTATSTRCCQTFRPIPTPSPASSPKACTDYRSRVTYYTSSFQPLASLVTYFHVQGNTLMLNGTYDGPTSELTFFSVETNGVYTVKGMGPKNSFTGFTPFDLKSDRKYLFSMALMAPDGPGHVDDSVDSLGGRIIVHNGLTEFEEGKSFTVNNDCVYASTQYHDRSVSTTEFCCRAFAI